MLYELLVGRLPEDPQELGMPGFMARLAMMATDPLIPSAKLATLVHHRETLASLRNTDGDGLRRELRGDLDWIVMRAIEKDRTRRYETANGLALDLQRYLRDEPVTARPPSVRYRARKFVRRHRVGVLAGAAVALAILAGAAAAALGLVRATKAEARALAEAATATQVSDFLVSLFQVSNPGEARGNTVTAREILDSGARKVEADLARQPLVQARLMKTIGDVYREMGLYDEAGRLLTRSLATRERMLGPLSPEVGGNLASLGRLYSDQARYAQAESTLIRAVALLEAPRGDRETAADPFAALSALGTLYQTTGRYAEADSVTRKALAALEKVAGPADPRLANQYNVLAILQAEQGRPVAAESLFRRVLAIRERAYGADHPDVSRALSNLASSQMEQGKFEEAEALYRRALAMDIKILGPEHSQVAFKLYNLANLREERGHLEEAIEHYRRASAIWEKSLGPDHPNIAAALTGLATVYNLEDRSAEAVPVLRRALAIREKNLAPDHPFIATTLHELGKAETRLRRLAEAETHLRRALEIRRKSLDSTSYHTSLTVYALANLHAERNQYADADSLYRQALAQWDASGHADTVARGEIVRARAMLFRRQGREAEARAVEGGD
jgi:tetratricopeptide (TPR) repeat protein